MKLQINPKQNIFFCSDPHYGQVGIVRGVTKWEDISGCRDFDTLEEHNETLINNINNTVGENDILFCLGDWSFGTYKNKDNVNNIRRFREQLNCKNIHLVLGNHDSEIANNKDNTQELFSSCNPYLEITVIEQPTEQKIKPIKQFIVLSHYAHIVWNKSHNGSWMLYGHSHGNLDGDIALDAYSIKNRKTMDVGFDTHPEFRPYSYEEVKELMRDRNNIKIDHHE